MNLIYKDALNLIVDPANQQISLIPAINTLLNKYNVANIDLEVFLKDAIKKVTISLIEGLLEYYKSSIH